MPTTASGLFYPATSDDVDVPGDLQALANSVEAALGLKLPTNRIAVGSVTITPVANTPTTQSVVFSSPLVGSNFYAQVSTNTAVPGTTVLGVGFVNLTSTGMDVVVTRTNTTNTVVHYFAIST